MKQTYLSSQRTLTRKIKEAALSIRLSRAQSKDQILEGYLNTIYWGRGAYGVEAASQAYFGVNVGKLDLPEAALLAGLIREPDSADPAHDPDLARLNQTDTLKAMVRDGHITEAEANGRGGHPVFPLRDLPDLDIRRRQLLGEQRRLLRRSGAPAALRQVRRANGRRGRPESHHHPRPEIAGRGLQRGVRS